MKRRRRKRQKMSKQAKFKILFLRVLSHTTRIIGYPVSNAHAISPLYFRYQNAQLTLQGPLLHPKKAI